MSDLIGFWSYVHADDEAESQRISQLARDVVAQFELMTGDDVRLFLDRDEIEWGENWQDVIDASLASVAFFIPILTPRYFKSPECRRELQSFARRARHLGIGDLVLPLLYVDFPAFNDDPIADDLVALVKSFQYVDWQDLRLADVTSAGYRTGVAGLASRLVEANQRSEEASISDAAEQSDALSDGDLDNSPGFVDQMAQAEEALPEWSETLSAISQEIDRVGAIMKEATADMQRGDAQGRGFSYKRIVARRVAGQLGEPADLILSLSNKYTSQLHDVDAGFRLLIDRASAETRDSPDTSDDVCEFFESVRGASSAARGGLASVQTMIGAMLPLEKISRDLRPPLRRMRRGLTVMVEGGEVTDEWVRLIESSGVECEPTDTQAS